MDRIRILDAENCLKAILNSEVIDESIVINLCTSHKFTPAAYRKSYNVAVLLMQRSHFSVAKKLLGILIDSKFHDGSCLGLSVRIVFLYVDSILKSSSGFSGVGAENLALLDAAFRFIAGVTAALRETAENENRVSVDDKEHLLQQLATKNSKLFDISQVFSVTLHFHSLICITKVRIACGDLQSARKTIHGGLELFRAYLLTVLQSPTTVQFEGMTQSGEQQDRLSGLLQDYCVCAPPLGPSVATLLALTIRIKQLLSVGTVLCARVEYQAGNFPLARLLLSEPALHSPSIKSAGDGAADEVCGAAELRNNEGCVALRQREFHNAAALFSQSLQAACRATQRGVLQLRLPSEARRADAVDGIEVRPGAAASAAIAGRLYNAGLALLRLERPLDAFEHLERACTLPAGSGSARPLVDMPHIWMRLADCCLQQHSLSQRTGAEAQPVPVVESVAAGKSRRMFLSTTPATAAASSSSNPRSSESAESSSGHCDLTYGVLCLTRALQLVERDRSSPNKGVSTPPQSRLEADALLRLTYALMQLGRTREALEAARRLVAVLPVGGSPPEEEALHGQHRFLASGYYVELLCTLGRQDEAAEYLKTHLLHWPAPSADALLGCHIPSSSFISGGGGSRQRHSYETRLCVAAAAQLISKAICLLARGMTSAASSAAESALRSCPGYVPALRCLAFIYLRQGRSRQALNILNVYRQTAAAKSGAQGLTATP